MTNSRVESSSGRAARKLRFALMGPAFIAAIGYIDPGNFATNIQAGASFGYKLLWVVVWANLMAMLIQMLSAKLGIATGKTRRSKSAIIIHVRQFGFTGFRRRLSPWLPISPSLSGRRSALSLSQASPASGAVLTGIATFLILMLQRRGKTAGESHRRPAAVRRCRLYC